MSWSLSRWLQDCRPLTLSPLWYQRMPSPQIERSLVIAWIVCLHTGLSWNECWTFKADWTEESRQYKVAGAGKEYPKNVWYVI